MIFTWKVWNYPYPVWQNCLKYKSKDETEGNPFNSLESCEELRTYQDTLILDLQYNGLGLALCLAAYVAAHLSVIIVRWVISGFKKDN